MACAILAVQTWAFCVPLRQQDICVRPVWKSSLLTMAAPRGRLREAGLPDIPAGDSPGDAGRIRPARDLTNHLLTIAPPASAAEEGPGMPCGICGR
jgi:hypothetical protein